MSDPVAPVAPVAPVVIIKESAPPKKHVALRVFGWLIFFLMLGGIAGVLYYYWDQIWPPIKKFFEKKDQEETPTTTSPSQTKFAGSEATPIPSGRKGSPLVTEDLLVGAKVQYLNRMAMRSYHYT